MASAAARIEPAWPGTLADAELPETMSWPSQLPAPHRDLGSPRDREQHPGDLHNVHDQRQKRKFTPNADGA
jgi:hypothetical protein